MNYNGFSAILCFIVIYNINICDSKCDEYVIIMKEISIKGNYSLTPIKLDEINWNDLPNPDNSTEIYNEINGYKGCLLEFECNGNSSLCFDNTQDSDLLTDTVIPGNDTTKLSRHREKQDKLDETKMKIDSNKTSEENNTTIDDNLGTDIEVTIKNCTRNETLFNATKIVCNSSENKSVNEEMNTSIYDVNIIYVNENDTRNNMNNQNKIVFCDYAEAVCIDDKNHSLSNDEYNITMTSNNKTIKALKLTLNRDQTSTVQPIFTGYFSPISADSNFTNNNLSIVIDPILKQFKSVTFSCKLKDDWNNCERSINNNSIKEANNTPGYSMNVYLKTNYIQNNTKTKYSNCTKNLKSTDSDSINIECEGTGFSDQNPQIVLPPEVNNNTSISNSNQSNSSTFKTELNYLLFWRCQVTDLNYTENTTLLFEQPKYNMIYLKKCSSGRYEINNNYSRDTLISTEKKELILNNIPANDDIQFKDTKTPPLVNNILNKDGFSIDKEKDIIKMHVTENKNNCIQNSTFSFIEGKMIYLAKDNIIIENILEYVIVELNVSNCIDDQYLIKNKTYQQTELGIIFNNSTNNTLNSILLHFKHEESYDKRHIILQCLYPSLRTDDKTKIILDCESIDIGDFNDTDLVNNTDIIHMTDTNETEHSNKCMTLECNSVEHKNNYTSKENNSNIVANSKDKSKRQNYNKRNENTEGLGQTSRALGNDNDSEKILLIVILAVAGASIVAILAIRKCPSQKEYNVAPTREAPDEEDTAL